MAFPFYSLPPEAREMVLEYVDVETKPRMMRINHNLREYVVKNGPFPKIINSIFITPAFNTSKDGKSVPQLMHLAVDKSQPFGVDSTWNALKGDEGRFQLKPCHPATSKDMNYSGIVTMRFLELAEDPEDEVSDFDLIEKIGFVFGETPFHLEEFFRKSFLAHFRQFHSLLLVFESVKTFDALFKFLKPSVANLFQINFHLGENNYLDPDIYSGHFQSYIKNYLTECRVVSLVCLPTSAISLFETFSQTKVQSFCFANVCSPTEIVKAILMNGVPSKFHEATLLLTNFHVGTYYKEIESMMVKTAGMTTISSHSWLGKQIINRFLEIYAMNGDVIDNTAIKIKPDYIFERQISATKRCTYILQCGKQGIEFFAKNTLIAPCNILHH